MSEKISKRVKSEASRLRKRKVITKKQHSNAKKNAKRLKRQGQ